MQWDEHRGGGGYCLSSGRVLSCNSPSATASLRGQLGMETGVESDRCEEVVGA